MGTIEEEQVRLFVEQSSPLDPIPVELPAPLTAVLRTPLPRSPRAILFDIYGTLFVSASGDIGASLHADSGVAPFRRAFELAGGSPLSERSADEMARLYHDAIAESHRASREHGVQHPEVEITSIWRRVVNRMSADGLEPGPVDVEILSVAYEALTNPVWPMPGAAELLHALRARSFPFGVVSNAQFYTRLLFRAFFGATIERLGFDHALLSFSYERGCAKPDPALFARPLASLQERGIDSTDTVYVGNDIRNDVFCARSAGCMTILFAGDARSLRLRDDDPNLAGVMPESVVTRLSDILPVCGME
ncbi:MAG: HAD family hydrolase [Spirochaetota bacterium]